MALSDAAFRITAVDATTEGINSVKSNLEGLKGSFTGLGASLSALAAAAGVGYFASMIQSTILANAELEKMAQKTGASAESLSGIASVAKRVGVDLEVVANSIGKLDKAMYAAATSGGTAQQSFDRLGVSVKDATGALRDPDAMLLDIARKFDEMGAGAERSALAQQLFGKAGIAMIPVLQELAITGEYVVKVTDRQAQLADDLEHNWKKLGAQGSATKQILANELTPSLDALVRSFVNVFNQSGGVLSKLKELASDGTLAAWAQRAGFILAELADAGVDVINTFGRMWETVKQLGEYLGGFGTVAIGLAQIMSGDLLHGAETLRGGWLDMKDATAGMIKAWQGASEGSHAFANAFAAQVITLATTETATRKQQKAVEDLGAATKNYTEHALRDFMDQMGLALVKVEAQLESLLKYGKTMDDTAVAVARFKLEHGDLALKLAILDQTFPALSAAIRAYALATAAATDEASKNVAVVKEMLAAGAKYQEQVAHMNDSVLKTLEAEKLRNQTFGMTKVQIADLMIAETQHQLQLEQDSGVVMPAVIAKLQERLDILRQTREQLANGEALQQNAAMWQSMASAASGFIQDLVTNGSSAFKNLWNNFKAWALQALAEIAAKQIVLSIVGTTASGGAGASGLLNSGGGLGGIGNIASLFSGGIGSITSAFGNLGFAFADFSQLVGQGVGIFQAAGTAFAGMGASLAAVVPVAGAVIAAGVMLYQFLKSKEGGPKEGGFASFNGTGGLNVDSDNNRYYTPNGADSAIQATVNTVGATFSALMKSLGGTSVANFGLGFDNDPKGKAGARISAGASVNGQSVYDVRNLSIDPKNISEELTTQASRTLLAALQKSDLPKYLADIFNSADAASASSETVQKLITAAQATQAFVVAMQGLGGVFEQLDPNAIAALGDAFGGLDKAMTGIGKYMDLFYTDTEKQAIAAGNLHKQFEALGIEEPKTKEAFRALVEGLDLTTEAGRTMYAALINLAPAFAQLHQEIVAAVTPPTITTTTPTTTEPTGTISPADQAYWDNYNYGAANALAAAQQAAAEAAKNLAAALAQARTGIADYLHSLTTNTALSPLSPTEMLTQAKNSFGALVAKAAAGDVSALQQISGSANTYLTQARGVYGSTAAYSQIFDQVTTILATLGHTDNPFSGTSSSSGGLTAALPTNGQLASSGDLAAIAKILDNLKTAMAGQAAAASGDAERIAESNAAAAAASAAAIIRGLQEAIAALARR